MAFVLPSTESAVATLQSLMEGVSDEGARERASRAAAWVRGISWDDVADLMDVWYQFSASPSGKTALQHGRPGVCA
jgi:hypothetical protein